MPKIESVASLIKAALDRGFTYQSISDASGGRISPNYVHDLGKGKDTSRLGVGVIVGLAKGIGESPIKVFCAAAGLSTTPKNPTLHQMIDDLCDLPSKDQDDLALLVKMLKEEIYKRSVRASS